MARKPPKKLPGHGWYRKHKHNISHRTIAKGLGVSRKHLSDWKAKLQMAIVAAKLEDGWSAPSNTNKMARNAAFSQGLQYYMEEYPSRPLPDQSRVPTDFWKAAMEKLVEDGIKDVGSKKVPGFDQDDEHSLTFSDQSVATQPGLGNIYASFKDMRFNTIDSYPAFYSKILENFQGGNQYIAIRDWANTYLDNSCKEGFHLVPAADPVGSMRSTPVIKECAALITALVDFSSNNITDIRVYVPDATSQKKRKASLSLLEPLTAEFRNAIKRSRLHNASDSDVDMSESRGDALSDQVEAKGKNSMEDGDTYSDEEHSNKEQSNAEVEDQARNSMTPAGNSDHADLNDRGWSDADLNDLDWSDADSNDHDPNNAELIDHGPSDADLDDVSLSNSNSNNSGSEHRPDDDNVQVSAKQEDGEDSKWDEEDLPPLQFAKLYDNTTAIGGQGLELDREPEDEEQPRLLEEIEENANAEAVNKALSCSLVGAIPTTVRDALAHKSEDVFKTTARVFPCVSIATLKQSSAIQPPNYGLAPTCKFFSYQLAFMAGGYVQEHTELLGGILGDEPGAGKTRQSLGMWVTHVHHVNNYVNVKGFWEDQPINAEDRHCAKDAAPDAACPMQKQLPIACWCSPSNRRDLYHNKVPTAGITLLITPSTGIPAYVAELEKMFDGSDFMGSMYSQPGQIQPRIAVEYDKYDLKGYGPLTEEERAKVCVGKQDANNETWKSFMGSHSRTRDTQVRCNHKDGHHKNTIKEIRVSHSPHGGSNGDGTQLEDTAGVLLITSRESIPARITSRYRTHFSARCQYAPGLTKHHPKKYPEQKRIEHSVVRLDIARLWWDECHVGGADNSTVLRLMQEQRTRRKRPPTVWGGSGTPDLLSPLQSIAFYVNLLANDDWGRVDMDGDKAILRMLFAEDKLNTLQKELQSFRTKAKHKPDDVMESEEAMAILDAYCKAQPLFQWARTHHDTWADGKPIIPSTCKLKEKILICEPDEQEKAAIERLEGELKSEREKLHRMMVEAWEAKPINPSTNKRKDERPSMPASSTLRPYHKAKAAASVSQLVEYWEVQIDEDETRTFVGHDKLLKRWNNRRNIEEMLNVVDKCGLRQSAKWKATKRLLDGWQKCKRKKAPGRCKVIVMTNNLGVMAVYSTLLRDEYGAENVVNVDASMTRKQKDEALTEFNRVDGPWIMMATLDTVKLSLNLQRANKTILMEPNSKEGTIHQAKCRSARLGQEENECEFVVAHNTASMRETNDLRNLAIENNLRSKLTFAALPTGAELAEEAEIVDDE